MIVNRYSPSRGQRTPFFLHKDLVFISSARIYFYTIRLSGTASVAASARIDIVFSDEPHRSWS